MKADGRRCIMGCGVQAATPFSYFWHMEPTPALPIGKGRRRFCLHKRKGIPTSLPCSSAMEPGSSYAPPPCCPPHPLGAPSYPGGWLYPVGESTAEAVCPESPTH